MKVIQVTTMKFLPGKMTEALELLKRQAEIAARLGGAPWKSYRCVSGERDAIHTLLFIAEWDSVAAYEAVLDKASSDPEMQQLMTKWETVVESDKVELYAPTPY